ncbi:MAG: 2-phosphosulfolactate phosphatase [Bacteroidales bacterium]
MVLCAGWEDTFSLEDATFAGALIETLFAGSNYSIPFDSSVMALELWKRAKENPRDFLQKGTHYERLKKSGAEIDFEYCIKLNTASVLPVMKGTHLKNIL